MIYNIKTFLLIVQDSNKSTLELLVFFLVSISLVLRVVSGVLVADICFLTGV